MYYRLNSDYEVCSFKLLPCSLRNVKTNEYTFYTTDMPAVIFKCNGKVNIDVDSLDEKHRDFIESAIESGMISESSEPDPMEKPIPVKYFKNKFRKTVHWSITGRCNFRCKHCFQSANEGVLGEPTLEQCMDIIGQMKECGIHSVDLTGGEPLIRKDFWQIIDALTDADIRVGVIYSNGALVNQKLLDGFKRRGMKPTFQISFDGPGCHDWLRGIPGAENMAVSAIKLLHENGFAVGCAMCIYKGNANRITDTAELLASIGCNLLRVSRANIEGEWKNHPDMGLSDDEIQKLYVQYIEEYYEKEIPIPIQLEGTAMLRPANKVKDGGKPVEPLIDQHCSEESAGRRLICGVLGSAFFIGPNGAVVPCMPMCGAAIEPQFPNLFEMPLWEILSDSSYITLSEAKVSDVLNANEKCIDCEYRYECLGGKCRQLAIGEDGMDYLTACEKTCHIFKSGWRDRIIKAVDEQNKKLDIE